MQTPRRRTHHSWPALYTAVLLTAGIVPAYRWLALPPLTCPVPLILSVLLCVPPCLALRRGGGQRRLLSALMVIGTIATGMLLGWESRPAPGGIPPALAGVPVTVAGEVIDQPVRVGNRIRFRVVATIVAGDSLAIPVQWLLGVSLVNGDPSTNGHSPSFGERVLLHGKVVQHRQQADGFSLGVVKHDASIAFHAQSF